MDKVCHSRFVATVFKLGCPDKYLWTLKRPFTISLTWDFDRIQVPVSDANSLFFCIS